MIPVIAPKTSGTTTTTIASTPLLRSFNSVMWFIARASSSRPSRCAGSGSDRAAADPARGLVVGVAHLRLVHALGRVVAAPRRVDEVLVLLDALVHLGRRVGVAARRARLAPAADDRFGAGQAELPEVVAALGLRALAG